MANSILIISKFAPPYEFSEGIVTGKLALLLKQQGWSVKIISGQDDGPAYTKEWSPIWESLQEDTKIIHYTTYNKLHRLIDLLRAIMCLKYPIDGVRWAYHSYQYCSHLIVNEHFDLIMSRSPQDASHLVALQLKKKHRIRWVTNWDDPASTIWPAPYNKKLGLLRNLAFSLFLKKVWNLSDFRSFPSSRLKTFFIDKFGSCNKNNFIIPHAILIYNSFLETTENKRSSEKKPIIRFCHSGNLSIERNPFNFLHAISKFIQETANENFRVDIIGKCDSSIDEIIKTLNLDKCVTVIGPLSYQETINQLANYDGFILLEAIMIEGIYLPSKISDYILFNKPIICISPDQGVIADLSKTCKQLFFASNLNVEEIKESITKVFNLLRAKSTPCIKESYINEKMLLNNSIVDTLTKITRS